MLKKFPNLKMSDNFPNICRMCLQENKELEDIFEQSRSRNTELSSIIAETLSLQIFKGDDLPQNICKECITKLSSIHENRRIFIENDSKLRKILVKNGRSEFVEVKIELGNHNFVNENDCNQKETDGLKVAEQKEIPEEIEDVIHDDNNDESEWEEDEEMPLKQTKKKNNRENKKEIKKRIRKAKPENFPRLNDNKCYICGEKFEEAIKLSNHLSQHLDRLPHNCKECVMEKVVIKSLTTLNVHRKMHAQPVKCNYCDKRYSSVQNRNLHVRNYHLSKDGDKSPVQCEICSKICPSEGSYKVHMKYHSNEIQCKICKKSFGTQRNLKRHELTHLEAKNFECSICNNKYCDINSYNVHMKRHNNERAHECQLCTAKFIMSSDLNYHMKVHQSDSEFQPKRNLKEFYTVKITEGTKSYHCNLCVKSFHRSANMTSHVSTHFKTRQCSFCGQRFKNGRALSDHENTHTGAKPYVCKTCGKGFANNTNLYQHHKIHKGLVKTN